jgi:hypothetical protein
MSGAKHPRQFNASEEQGTPKRARDANDAKQTIVSDRFCCTNPLLGQCMTETNTLLKYPGIGKDPKKCFANKELCHESCRLPAAITNNILLFGGPSIDWKSTMQSQQQKGQAFLVTQKPLAVESDLRKSLIASQQTKPLAKQSYYINLLRAIQLQEKKSLHKFEQAELANLMENPVYWDQASSEARDAMYLMQLNEEIVKMSKPGIQQDIPKKQLVYGQILSLIRQRRGVDAYEFIVKRFVDFLLQVDIQNHDRAPVEEIILSALQMKNDLWQKEGIQREFWLALKWVSGATQQNRDAIARLTPHFFPCFTDWKDTEFNPTEAIILTSHNNYVNIFEQACRLVLGRAKIEYTQGHQTANSGEQHLESLFNRFTRDAEEHYHIAEWVRTLVVNLPIENIFIILMAIFRSREVPSDLLFPWIMPVVEWVQALSHKIHFGTLMFQRFFEGFRFQAAQRPCPAYSGLNSKTRETFVNYVQGRETNPDYFIIQLGLNVSIYHWCVIVPQIHLYESQHEAAKKLLSASEESPPAEEPSCRTRYENLRNIPAAVVSQMEARRLDQEQKARALLDLNLAAPAAAAASALASTVLRPAAAAAAAAALVTEEETDIERTGGCQIVSCKF